jgi:NCS1 family nucleobase:cation symporter-1
VAILGTALGILASAHFLTDLSNFVLFLLYFMIPWTAINLTDYYVVRRGRYVIADIFKTNGIYGRVNWWGVGIYLLAILVEIPFVNSSVGFIVAAVLYYLTASPHVAQAAHRA